MKRTLWVVIVLLAALLLVSNYLLETSQFNSFTSEINIPAWLKNAVSTLTGQKDKKPEFSAIDWKTYSENGCTWKKNTLLSNYELYGSHSPAWDDEVIKFFENYSALYFTDWADEAKNKQILAQADELIKLGCDDPYILYIQGQLTYHYSDGLDGQTILKKSFVLLENSDYPAFCKFRAAQDLQKANEWAGKHVDSIHDARRKKMIYLGKASGDQAFADGNQRYYMTSMTSLWNDGMPKEMELLLYELENTPNADPWIKLMVNGFYHNTRGWEMRGGAVGNLVKEKQWEVFHEEIRQARDCFTRAHEMHPEFPDAAIMMIKISMSDGSSKREQRQWFDRSVAAHFDYLKAYENYFWALRPRWGGSHEEMLQFGVECLNTGRFDTAVPASFLIALWDVGSELPDWRAPYQAPGTFENLKKFYAGILIQSSKKSEQYYWQTSQAVTYWAAGHYEESKKILDELGDNLDMPCLQSFDIKKDQVFGEVNLHTSPFKDLALQAETLYSDNMSLEALPHYAVLRENLQSDPYALRLINNRIATLTLKQNYLKDGWVNLIPAADLAGWDIKGGSWEIENDGALKGTPDRHNNYLMLLGQFPVTGNYELRGEIESCCKGAIFMGYIRGHMGREYISFSINTKSKRAYLSERISTSPNALRITISPLENNSFLLRVADGRITALLNGDEIFTDAIPDYRGYSPHNGVIGLGQYFGRNPDHHILYRNLQIRKID